MPEHYPGHEPDPMLSALFDVTATLGAKVFAQETNEASGLSLPGESQGPVTDPELVELLNAAGHIVGHEALNRLLAANDRFNQPATVIDDYGRRTHDDHYSHRRFLSELPGYAAAAQRAGLSPTDMEESLKHAWSVVNYPDIEDSFPVTARLTKALQASVARGEELTPQDVGKLRDLMSRAGADDAIKVSLDAYTAGREAGLALDDSIQIVKGHLDTANYRQIGYHMQTLTYALRALNVANVEPAVTNEIFAALEQEHPEDRHQKYKNFKDALEILCPVRGISPNEFMQQLAGGLRTGLNFGDALKRIVDQGPPLPSSREEVTVIVPQEQLDRYFPNQKGELRHAVLPYQIQRPLNDGLRDIERLTDAHQSLGDVVSEGLWVFDPSAGTWYSLGGSTTYVPSSVRHSSIAYDHSRLSDSPYIFHIHPKEFAIGADKFGFIFPSNADYWAAARVMSDAERPVHPRSFISHPMGITEFIFPAEPERVQEVAEHFQEVRDALFNRFGGDPRDISNAALRMGEQAFADMVVRDINAVLPEGFAIKLHPHGVDLERLIAEE